MIISKKIILSIVFGLIAAISISKTSIAQDGKAIKLHNPITVSYLEENLQKSSPKLILSPALERNLKSRLKNEKTLKKYYQYLEKKSEVIMEKPLLKRELEGFRILAVSAEMVERMGVLSMVYRIDKNPEILERIDEEVKQYVIFQTGTINIFLMWQKCLLPWLWPSTGRENGCQYRR